MIKTKHKKITYLTVSPEESEELVEALHIDGATLVELSSAVVDVEDSDHREIPVRVSTHRVSNSRVTDGWALHAGVLTSAASFVLWHQIHVEGQLIVAAEFTDL